MQVESACPSCGATKTADAGEPVSCGACGHWFVPGTELENGRQGAFELELQYAPGDPVRGPFDRIDLRERLYRGLLTGDEHVRPVGGRFVPLRSLPDFAQILTLLERGKPKPVLTRKAAPAPEPAAPAPAAAPKGAAIVAAGPPPAEAPQDKARLATIGGVTFLVGLLLVGFALLVYSMSL